MPVPTTISNSIPNLVTGEQILKDVIIGVIGTFVVICAGITVYTCRRFVKHRREESAAAIELENGTRPSTSSSQSHAEQPHAVGTS